MKKPKMTLTDKKATLDKLLEERFETAEPEQEVQADPFGLDMDIVSAIRLIQKNERGRQYRIRVQAIYKMRMEALFKEEQERLIRAGVAQEMTEEQKINEAAVRA